VKGLLVEGTFPSDHEIGSSNATAEVGGAEDEIDAASPAGAEHEQAVTEPAGGSRTRSVLEAGGARHAAADDVDEVGESGLEESDVLRADALLRSVDSRSAVWAEERVVDVGGGDELSRWAPALPEVDVVEGVKASRDRLHTTPTPVAEAYP
jgi:hypothetical protein